MLDYLVNHARKNVWCTPDQDLQVIFKPARITPINGVSGRFQVMWKKIHLPTQNDRYHVYQIGQRHPMLIGLVDIEREWVRLSDICNAENLIVDVYVTSGIQFPRFETWMWVGPDRNLLIAVKINSKIADLNDQPLFIRFYSNAYFNSVRKLPEDKIYVRGQMVETEVQRLQLQQDFLDHQALIGHAYAFVNGRVRHAINPFTCKLGDYAEFVYDSSIYRVIDLKIDDLDTFESVLDQKRKYLIHYGQMLNDTIDYRDDIDLWIVEKEVDDSEKFKGVYYHKNQEDAVRMVTHKDYSVPVMYVDDYVEDNPEWTDAKELFLRLHVRKSGYYRPLIDEHHRIKELYKLNQEDVKRAMLGIDSVVDEWRAENLELSGYTEIMRDGDGLYEPKLVQDAYGYNAITKLVADTPQEVKNDGGVRYVDVPYALRGECTAYEYNSNGKLIGFYHHLNGDRYYVSNNNAALVELISGIGSENQGTVFGENMQQLNPEYNYRFYKCRIVNDVPTEEWEDVTGTSDYTITQDNKVSWNIDFGQWLPAVRGDNRHLTYSVNVPNDYGLVRFTVNALEPRYGVNVLRPSTIPPGKLDLWMNGHCLIENLDYYVKWPQIVICNKQHLQPSSQVIAIRASGFCNSDLEREDPAEFGFVDHGLMSRNGRYNVRDDKVIRIVVDGCLKTRDELIFSENDSGITMEDIRNGAPYVIDDVVVPLRGVDGYETYEFRQRSLEVDQKISDYLTLKLPEPEKQNPNIIPFRYQVYSPITSKVMHDLQEGFIDNDEIRGHYSDAKIWDLLENYLYLLDFEPTKKGYNQNYVQVHPHQYDHVVELDIYQYTFLQRMIRVVLDDKIDISSFIRIGDLI